MFERLKDWIYDSSDLFTAIIIIIFAAFIITGRIHSIMAYPETLNAATSQETGTQAVIHSEGSTKVNTDTTTTPANSTTVPTQQQTDASAKPTVSSQTQPPAGGNVKITIPQGAAGERIAKILVENGLVNQSSDFLNVLKKSGLESKLRSGTYNIPSGSTPDQIIKILTEK